MGEEEAKSKFLTYLLKQKSLTPAEANSHVIDLMTGAVETVSDNPWFSQPTPHLELYLRGGHD